MAIFNTDLDYTQLIQFTNGTLQLGSFVQIRNALVKRMKELYGNDIDVSPASADGQYINSLALIFNNILQTIRKGNDSLDPAAATGRYLDTLCSFNNISRIEPTASVAELYLYNSTGSAIRTSYLTFIDKNNLLWVWDNGGKEIEIPVPTPEKPAYLLADVVCEELGKITAKGTNTFYAYNETTGSWDPVSDPLDQTWDKPELYSTRSGTIFQCVEQNGLYVWQYKDAEPGENRETDESLRSRRYQMLGNRSVTVLEGLKGNILSLSAVKDAYIFNNQTTGDDATKLTSPVFEPVADGCNLKGHSIYIAVRYKEGVEIDDEIVGKAIYGRLTPGISTSPFKSLSAKSYSLMSERPADWNIAYTRYCVMNANDDPTWAENTFYSKSGNAYSLLLEEPADWESGYAGYYKPTFNSSPDFVANTFASPDDSRMLEIVRTDEFSDFVYWKVCSSTAPKITMKFNTNAKLYDYPTDLTSANTNKTDVEKAIISSLKNVLGEAKINDWLSVSSLLTAMQQSDRQKNGMPTFLVERGYFGENSSKCIYPANLSYFSYSDESFSFEYETDQVTGLPAGPAILTIG